MSITDRDNLTENLKVIHKKEKVGKLVKICLMQKI